MKPQDESEYAGELNDLPEDSNFVKPYLLKLREKAQREIDPLHVLDFSDGVLIRFLRARDFDFALSLKVCMPINAMTVGRNFCSALIPKN